ncbi:CU044_5270 family protein [Lentzea sp. NPDC051838]|uniref:CU044_5270 family protein n=1 Tax=Lentzea sp. NPDC051838 TaxID=3154849 RepID=UPI00341AA97A
MDEIQLIRGMVAETRLPESGELSPIRERLLAGARAEARPAVARSRRRFTLAGVVGIAAAIAAVVVVAPFGGPSPEAHAEAVETLHRAAAAVRGLQETPPRADQFIYTKTEQDDGIREAWLSADGTRDGLVRQHTPATVSMLPGCRDGKHQVYVGPRPLPGEFGPCTLTPAYRPDMPTDARAMLAYLNGNGLDDLDRSNANDRPVTGDDVAFLLRENYLSPQSRAALYEALALIPDITLEHDEEDAAGRRGVKVSWPDKGDHRGGELILDPATYTVLGSEDTAVLQTAVVDQSGQRP